MYPVLASSIMHHAPPSRLLYITYDRVISTYLRNLQLDALFVLKLPSRPIRGPEAELIAIQLKLDVGAVQYRRQPLVPTSAGAVRS